MSHFSVLLITSSNPTKDQVADIMQPWHEFECTGVNNQYVLDVDITDKVNAVEAGTLAEKLEYHGLDESIVESDDEIDRNGEHKFGYAHVVAGNLVKAVRRTNPNKHWDWWVIGGRWTGHFTAHGGDRRNALRFDEWALDGQLSAAGRNAGERFDQFHAIIADHPTIAPWKSFVDDADLDWEATLAAYWGQPAMAALKAWVDPTVPGLKPDPFNTGFLRFGENAEDFLVPREQYVANVQWSRVGTFAIVDARETPAAWLQKGDMGWFACVSNEDDLWHEKALAHVRALPADAYLTIIDCHI